MERMRSQVVHARSKRELLQAKSCLEPSSCQPSNQESHLLLTPNHSPCIEYEKPTRIEPQRCRQPSPSFAITLPFSAQRISLARKLHTASIREQVEPGARKREGRAKQQIKSFHYLTIQSLSNSWTRQMRPPKTGPFFGLGRRRTPTTLYQSRTLGNAPLRHWGKKFQVFSMGTC